MRTGIPPRAAKQILTSSEVAELKAYYRRFPFDDENAFQVPAAQLAALYSNAHKPEGAALRPIDDFLVFRPRSEDDLDNDVDQNILKFFEGL